MGLCELLGGLAAFTQPELCEVSSGLGSLHTLAPGPNPVTSVRYMVGEAKTRRREEGSVIILPLPLHSYMEQQQQQQQEGLTWQVLEWRDGTRQVCRSAWRQASSPPSRHSRPRPLCWCRYEGLTKGGTMHSHGVLTFPNKDRCAASTTRVHTAALGCDEWPSRPRPAAGMRVTSRMA